MNGGERWGAQKEWSPEPGQEDPRQAPNHTETPVLSPALMDPQVALGHVSLNTARHAGGGRGRACRGRGLRGGAGPQLHLQERTIMLDSCSTLALRPT